MAPTRDETQCRRVYWGRFMFVGFGDKRICVVGEEPPPASK
jgi:hypothetical protein